MIKFNKLLIFSVFLITGSLYIRAQESQSVELKLTLGQAIELAQKQSIQSFRNKNMYLAKYWEFRSYKGSRLPSLDLDASPLSYSSAYENINNKSYDYNETLNSYGKLSINQNVTLTGGVVSIFSDLRRYENFVDDTSYFVSTPVSLSFSQPLSGYNEFRWQSKLEPLKFEKAKREYLQDSEGLAIRTVQFFFNLVADEINLKITETNYNNADTLYRIAKGRFEIGTVTQDELLDLELGLLNARIDKVKSELSLKQSQISLNSFLGLDEKVIIRCIVPNNIPDLELEMGKVLAIAIENNPEILGYQQSLLQAQQDIASTRAHTGLEISTGATYGVNDQAVNLQGVYEPDFSKNASYYLRLSVPILDWGERRGQIQMAKANRDAIEAEVRQARIDFNQNVFQQVAEFNMQDEQVEIAAKADTVAALGYEVTKQRFLIDKVDVIKLNSARNSVDAARRNYVDALRRYWNYYYSIRQLTLYDFEDGISLMKELDYLLEK